MSESSYSPEGQTTFSRLTSRLFRRERAVPVHQHEAPHTEEQRSIEEELQRIKNLPGITEALALEPGQEKFVHATPMRDVAELINKNGLYCAYNGLSGIAQRIPEEGDERFHPLVIRHNGYRYNTIITLPEFPEDIRIPMREKNNAMALQLDRAKLLRRELSEDQTVGGGNTRRYEYYLPARYIQGYLDIEQGGFTRNEGYNPVIDNEEHARLKHNIDSLTPESYHEFN